MKAFFILLILMTPFTSFGKNSPWSPYTMTYLDRLLITMEMKEPEFEDKFFLVGFRKRGKDVLLVEIEKSNQFIQLKSRGLTRTEKEQMNKRRIELEEILIKDIKREMKAFGIKGLKIKFSDL